MHSRGGVVLSAMLNNIAPREATSGIVEDVTLLAYRQLGEDERSAVAELITRVSVSTNIEDGSIVIKFENIDPSLLPAGQKRRLEEARIDMNSRYNVVAGSEIGQLTLVNALHGCTRACFVVKTQYDEKLSPAACRRLLRFSFAPLKLAQKTNERCREIDERARQSIASDMLKDTLPLQGYEADLILRHSALMSTEFTRFKGSLAKYPTLALFYKKDSAGFWGKAVGRIDTSANTIAALLWSFTAYNRVLDFRSNNGNLPCYEFAVPNSRSKFMVAGRLYPKGLGNRLYENW